MALPTIKEAKDFLAEAGKMNPGAWVEHSKYVADAARIIASHHPGLDPDRAYIFGCLHDIGRREGVYQNRHIIDGYRFLQTRQFSAAARICLTHSFPVKDIKATPGTWECSVEDYEFIEKFLNQIEYSDYDRLIQLCDALVSANGFCLIEKRFVDVAIRYGTDEYTILRWHAYLNIKKEFEKTLKQSIYSILPGIIENTFEMSHENAD